MRRPERAWNEEAEICDVVNGVIWGYIYLRFGLDPETAYRH
jgi:hypothetical protein